MGDECGTYYIHFDAAVMNEMMSGMKLLLMLMTTVASLLL